MKRSLSAAMSLLLAAASASAQVPLSSLTKIGTAAAVAGAVKAVSAGSPVGHVISSGKPLFLNDHVTTDAAGRLQVLLVDETIFTLGPNSDMVLDDFVYDPKTSAGKITATIAKGAFRFVTGKVAQRDPSKLKIKVAVGTIGVRGSIGVGETGPGGTTIINGGARNADNHDDSAGIYAESGGHTVNLPQPGVGTRISPDGAIAKAGFMTDELNRIMGTLQTQPGRTAGKGGGNGDAFGKRSATDASGRSTSVGGLLAADSADSADLVTNLDSILVNTVQAISGGTISTWDSIRNVNGGTGNYVGNGTLFCTGGTCGAGGSGVFDFNIPIDFSQKTIGGGANTAIHLFVPSASFSDNTNLNSISYANFSGQAKYVLTNSDVSNTNFSAGTAFILSDRNGTTAKDMTVNLQYLLTPSTSIKGTASGSR